MGPAAGHRPPGQGASLHAGAERRCIAPAGPAVAGGLPDYVICPAGCSMYTASVIQQSTYGSSDCRDRKNQ